MSMTDHKFCVNPFRYFTRFYTILHKPVTNVKQSLYKFNKYIPRAKWVDYLQKLLQFVSPRSSQG